MDLVTTLKAKVRSFFIFVTLTVQINYKRVLTQRVGNILLELSNY